jgi:hypothetical protein
MLAGIVREYLHRRMKMKRIGIFLVLAAVTLLTGCLSFLSDSGYVSSNFKSKYGSNDFYSAVYSKDGRFLFTGGAKNNALIAKYDAVTGKLVKKFEKVKNTGDSDLLLSEDGRSLLVRYGSFEKNPNSYIYDVESGKILHTISRQERYFADSDGFRTMNATRLQNGGFTIKITDTVTGAIIRETTVPDFAPTQVKRWGRHYISKDGRFYDSIGYAHDSNDTFWIICHVDLEDPNLTTSYIPSDLDYFDTLPQTIYSPDGKYMAVSFYRSVFPRAEYDTRLAQAQQAANRVHSSLYDSSISYNDALDRAVEPYGIFISRSGEKWTYGWERKPSIRVFNLATGELVGEAVVNSIRYLVFGPDSKSLYGTGRYNQVETILKGTLGSNGKWQFNNRWEVGKGDRFLCFSPDGKRMLVQALYTDSTYFIDLD